MGEYNLGPSYSGPDRRKENEDLKKKLDLASTIGRLTSQMETMESKNENFQEVVLAKVNSIEHKVDHIEEITLERINTVKDELETHKEYNDSITEDLNSLSRKEHEDILLKLSQVYNYAKQSHGYAIKLINEQNSNFQKYDSRILILEDKDNKVKAHRYDKSKNWIITILIGALAGWLTTNFSNILSAIAVLFGGGS